MNSERWIAELVAALQLVTNALGAVDDYGTATGLNPDVQNRALDVACAVLAKAQGKVTA